MTREREVTALPGTASVLALLAAGLVAGTLFLGVGGRIAMRLVALAEGQAVKFTLPGTLTVVAAGAIWGTVTSPVLLIGHRWRRSPRWRAALEFGGMVLTTALIAVALLVRGRPTVSARFVGLAAALFIPLFVMHGGAVVGVWRRPRRRVLHVRTGARAGDGRRQTGRSAGE